MNDSTNTLWMSTREFYAQSEIAPTYNELCFGGASGAWVNAREIELALSLLPLAGVRVLARVPARLRTRVFWKLVRAD
jgi:hypothetical protein